MISTKWPYYYNTIFRRQMFFIMMNTHQKWEELRKMVVGGQKITKKIDFLKNFDFCDFWFFCVFRRARWCWTFCSLWMYYKKLQKVVCGDEKTILRENGFSPTDIEKVFFWPIFSRRLSPPAVPGNSYGRWGESSLLMLSLKPPKNEKVKIFEFLTPSTWPKVQLIAIQRPKSLKDYFLESRFMAACKNSANSNGGVSRTRRGVFILNTYRSTPYLERRADGAPPPVLTETGCTSSGHLAPSGVSLLGKRSNWVRCLPLIVVCVCQIGAAVRSKTKKADMLFIQSKDKNA